MSFSQNTLNFQNFNIIKMFNRWLLYDHQILLLTVLINWKLDFMLSNSPRSIYQYSDMALRLSGQTSILCIQVFLGASFTDQTCSVKMAGYSPSSFCVCLWTETELKKRNLSNIQPPRPHSWSLIHVYFTQSPCTSHK